MAVADQFETVQKLYIAFYQRPADFAGRQYWAEQVEAQGLQSVINAFATSDEATALYGEINNDTIGDVIDAIYQAAFGRAADAEGKAYYVAEFEAGNFTAATIALNVVNGAVDADATVLGNKVQAADLFTAAVEGVEYNEADITAARDFLAGVTDTVPTQAEVDAVVEGIGGEGEVSELNAALLELQQAEQARAEFLQGALENDAVVEVAVGGADATPSAIVDAIGVVAGASVTTVAGLAAADSEKQSIDYTSSFATASAAVRASMISEVRAVYEQAVAEEQADVNAVAGLSAAITSLNAAKNAYATAATATAAADVNLDGEIARFEALNDNFAVAETASPAYGLTVTFNNGTDPADVYNITLSGRTLVVPADLKALNLVGLDAVVQDAQSFYNASLAETNAENSLASAIAKALNLENDLTGNAALTAADVVGDSDYYTTTPTDSDNDGDLDVELGTAFDNTDIVGLVGAQEDLATFNSAVEAYTAAQQLSVSLAERDDAITAARGVIEELDYVIGSTAGSVDNDVFVFADANMDISGFGAQGDDVLFLGEGFGRVDLGNSINLLGTAQGDASVLEVFFQQDGVDAKIYVEGAAFAGSATNGFQGNVITLTGVAVEDLTLSADGFITVA